MSAEQEVPLLPEIDRDLLEEKEFTYCVTKSSGGGVHLVIRDFELPASYMPRKADLLIIIPAGYPNSHPDMFWTFPDVKRIDGRWPQNCEHHQTYGDRNWQRWSRHYQGQWRAGTDGLRSYLAAVRREIAKGL